MRNIFHPAFKIKKKKELGSILDILDPTYPWQLSKYDKQNSVGYTFIYSFPVDHIHIQSTSAPYAEYILSTLSVDF